MIVSILADSQLSDFGIASRNLGTCQFSQNQNAIYYFAGQFSGQVRSSDGSWVANATDKILKYDLDTQIWTEFGSVLATDDFGAHNIQSVILNNGENGNKYSQKEIWILGVHTEESGYAGIVVFDTYLGTSSIASVYANISDISLDSLRQYHYFIM